ncbi:hypothetical protein U9M48_036500 [Paspalum notatum var. saurae]|uniref:Uncharacterized protein n=1 Tax=Paspalum notatum var. saurae TaxID=547442 RepID=A0AAQ3UFD4_PASNO
MPASFSASSTALRAPAASPPGPLRRLPSLREAPRQGREEDEERAGTPAPRIRRRLPLLLLRAWLPPLCYPRPSTPSPSPLCHLFPPKPKRHPVQHHQMLSEELFGPAASSSSMAPFGSAASLLKQLLLICASEYFGACSNVEVLCR